jgi:hypothetical protein
MAAVWSQSYLVFAPKHNICFTVHYNNVALGFRLIQKLYKEMELKIILINGFCFLKKEIQANFVVLQ